MEGRRRRGEGDPVCFLVVNGTSVKVLPVDAAPETSLDRVVDMIPDVVNKITGLIEEKKAKNRRRRDKTRRFAPY